MNRFKLLTVVGSPFFTLGSAHLFQKLRKPAFLTEIEKINAGNFIKVHKFKINGILFCFTPLRNHADDGAGDAVCIQ